MRERISFQRSHLSADGLEQSTHHRDTEVLLSDQLCLPRQARPGGVNLR